MAKNPVLQLNQMFKVVLPGRLSPMTMETIYNPKYPDRPYSVILKHSTSDQRDQMWLWCGEMFGVHTKQWNNPRWSLEKYDYRFHFKNEEDAALFVLRWS